MNGRPGEAYNVGGPDECENIEVVKRVIELTGADESLIEYVTDRPGHDRRYSLSSEKLRDELGWEAQVHFAEGLERTVDWYRDNEEWWGPIRSGEYREYYEKQYGKSAGLMAETVCRPKLDGVVLLEPPGPRRRARLHGRDLQPRRLGRARGRRRVRPAQPLALARGRRCAASTSRPSPARRSWSAAPAARSSTSPSTCAATRRPSASGRATSSTTSSTASSSSRSASATASPSSARSPTSPTSSPATTTRRPRRASPGTTPTSASSGRSPSRCSPSATVGPDAGRGRATRCRSSTGEG